MKLIWGDLPTNTPEGVGRAFLLSAHRQYLNGLSLFVHGDQITDLEEGLAASMAQWMGNELSEVVMKSSAVSYSDCLRCIYNLCFKMALNFPQNFAYRLSPGASSTFQSPRVPWWPPKCHLIDPRTLSRVAQKSWGLPTNLLRD